MAEKKNKGLLSKRFVAILFLIIQLLLLAGAIILAYFFPIFSWVAIALRVGSLIVAIFIVNAKMDATFKISWLFFLLILPVFGAAMYLLFANKKFTKKEVALLTPLIEEYVDTLKKMPKDTFATIDRNRDPECYCIANYIVNYNVSAPYKNTRVQYFELGEKGFPLMLEKLKLARKFIFMEYFIITPGTMWEQILKILKEKAAQGVQVNLIYDDLGCASLPAKYPEELAKFGIHASCYCPIRPVLDIRMNNRDHRKILVIDGLYGFTGGINIADEYINEIERFGQWKDNILYLEGEGVFGLTSLFLATWYLIDEKNYENTDQTIDYMYCSLNNSKASNGYVQPYGSIPFTYETIGENVYINMCLKAKKYLYISTPYLILDDNMSNAICLASKNGVDVRLVMPGIPDKKAVFELSRSFYDKLVEADVKIYEYTPGFVHQKVFLCDDVMATVGTINLDYRSLYLHLENGVFLYKVDALKDIKKDFEDMFTKSELITEETIKKTKFFTKVFRSILRIIAPLL